MSQKTENKNYWYKFITHYCPQCGRDRSWKERIYTEPKPQNPQDRRVWKDIWDYCGL